MFSLKEKFGNLKDDAKIIENNIDKLKIILDNERKNILDLQDEIEKDYDLITKKIELFEKKEKELHDLKEELKDIKQNMIESNIENKILKEKIENLTKDNKELKEKLYQKEKDELKFKILSNENTANIKNLAGKIDKQNNEINQYKVEIANLKANIEKQNTPKKIEKDIEKVISSNPIKNTSLNNINFSKKKTPIEPKTKHLKLEKEKKTYIDLLKEINLDTNNIEKFILDRSKSLEDPEELSTNDWKKILSFGVTHNILTNREIQQLKQISLMLGNSGYKNERSKLLNKVKENGFEISLYKVDDWEKVLDFLEEKKAITKEVKECFISIFKKYKKKKMFKLKQLKFILPYLEKYKEDIEKNKEIAEDKITIKESSNEDNEKLNTKILTIETDKSIAYLILEKYRKYKNSIDFEDNEWKELLRFGLYFNLFNKVDRENINSIRTHLKYGGRLYSDLLENGRKCLELAKTNGFEISLFDYDEWNKIINYLKDRKILTSNIIKEFYNISNESEETGVFNLEQLKFILPYFEKFKGLENESETIEKSKYNLSEKQDRILKKLKSFSSKEWEKLSLWSEDKLLIETKDIKMLDSLIDERTVEEFNKSELISLIELYNYLIDEGFDKKDFNLEKKEANTNLKSSFNENIEDDKNTTTLIMNKLKTLDNVVTFSKEEWENILNFGIQYGLFNLKETLKAEKLVNFKKNGVIQDKRMLEMEKTIYKIVERNGYNASIFDFFEWNKVLNHLKDKKIITPNIIHEFYNISNESEETGFFSLEQLKFISPYLNKFKDLINTNEKNENNNIINEKSSYEVKEENGDIEYNKVEEFKESKYDLSDKENRTLRELKLFSSKDWKNLTIWSKKRSLIENEDIEIIDYLIYGTSNQKFEEFEEFELITLIELYDHLKKEGFNVKDFNLEKEEHYDTLLEELELFDPEDWKKLYEWSDKKLLIQHEDHKLLDPLVNGGFIEEINGSDLINLLDLYDRLVEKGFKKNLNISKENTSEIFKNSFQQDDDKLLEEVKKFESKDWIEILDWSKKNKKLKTRDYNFLSNLAFKSINNKLNDKELILGLEIYFIAKSEGFKRVKDEDIDNFLMQFIDETEDKEEEINLDFEYLVNKGLENGFIEYTMLEKIDYDKEIEISDHFEAIEVLEDRGIAIKY